MLTGSPVINIYQSFTFDTIDMKPTIEEYRPSQLLLSISSALVRSKAK